MQFQMLTRTMISLFRLPLLAGPEEPQLEAQHVCAPCIMHKMRDKAIAISNAFRTSLGLPLIEAPNLDFPKEHHDDPMFRILPFIGTPPAFIKNQGNGALTGITGEERLSVSLALSAASSPLSQAR
ncbi:hypothetical protein F5887DRAFT_1085996 [Amanita rubescens]|nr:hypothetical protein F5887DRAFT_1085996 [Amanita rubescens]